MEVYMVGSDELIRIPDSELGKEQHLEEHLSKSAGAEIGGVEIMYIGRQESPSESGIFDLLGVDNQGNTVVLELKRDRPTRDIVSQGLEYASGIRNEDYEQLNEWFQKYSRQHSVGNSNDETCIPTLAEAHAEYFELEDTLSATAFNNRQRLILVGTDFTKRTLELVDFLRVHDIDVICVEYQTYKSGSEDVELLATDSVRRPLSEEPDGTKDSGLTDYRRQQLAFWEGFVEEVGQRETAVSGGEPQPNTSIANRQIGRSGCRIVYYVVPREDTIRCQLNIESDDELFQALRRDEKVLTEEFIAGLSSSYEQTELEWEPADQDGGRHKIKTTRSVDVDDEDSWPDYYDWLIEVGEQMHTVFVPRIREW